MKTRFRHLTCASMVTMTLTLATTLTFVTVGWACSGMASMFHTLRWTGPDSLIALADPQGRVVALGAQGAKAFPPTKATKYRGHERSDVSPDGKTLATIELVDVDTACAAEWVAVWTTDIASGGQERLVKLKASAAFSLHYSPGGSRLAVLAHDQKGIARLHVFDVAKRQRVRVAKLELRAEEITADMHQSVIPSGRVFLWLDDARMAVWGPRDGEVRIVEADTGRLIKRIPSAPREVTRTLLPGDNGGTGFTAVDSRGRMSRLVKVGIDASGAISVDRADWSFTGLPRRVSADGRWLLIRGPDARQYMDNDATKSFGLVDRATGKRVGTIEGQYAYQAAELSPDGKLVALTSWERPPTSSLEGLGDPDAMRATTIEILDLATGKSINHWGVQARSRITR